MPWYNNEIMIDMIFHNNHCQCMSDHDIYMSIYEY